LKHTDVDLLNLIKRVFAENQHLGRPQLNSETDFYVLKEYPMPSETIKHIRINAYLTDEDVKYKTLGGKMYAVLNATLTLEHYKAFNKDIYLSILAYYDKWENMK
jgi:hypothetical protein